MPSALYQTPRAQRPTPRACLVPLTPVRPTLRSGGEEDEQVWHFTPRPDPQLTQQAQHPYVARPVPASSTPAPGEPPLCPRCAAAPLHTPGHRGRFARPGLQQLLRGVHSPTDARAAMVEAWLGDERYLTQRCPLDGGDGAALAALPPPALAAVSTTRLPHLQKHGDGSVSFWCRCDRAVYRLLWCARCLPLRTVVGVVVEAAAVPADIGLVLLFLEPPLPLQHLLDDARGPPPTPAAVTPAQPRAPPAPVAAPPTTPLQHSAFSLRQRRRPTPFTPSQRHG